MLAEPVDTKECAELSRIRPEAEAARLTAEPLRTMPPAATGATALLVEASRRLSKVVRDADTVARLGGDEFAILLPEIHELAQVEEIATRALAALSAPFKLKLGVGNVSCSLGIALFPEHGSETDVLQNHADRALYAAKNSGRNCFRVYSSALG